METWNIFIASDLPDIAVYRVRIALEGLWGLQGYWLTFRKLSELEKVGVPTYLQHVLSVIRI
jgi:hypothetical protein